ncbi:MAG TPA: AMP-binding protein [Candidatus Angelobacter sp.]|jgi:acyl-CoA synthetase (AMP-forming)/AMP-acid ligase II|nr:AMP-binding protein [Candidatus Angelobacter sp.]
MPAGETTSSLTLFEHFTQEAAKNPDRPAFTFLTANLEAKDYTFGELFERTHTVAEALARHQLDDHSLVGILVESQEAQVLHYLAALSLGLTPAILTPPNRKMNYDYYLRNIQGVLGYCGFSAVITSMTELAPVVPVLEPYTTCPRGEISRPAATADSEAAFLQFSSGTTGIKRGVIVNNRAVLSQLTAYGGAIGLTPGDTIVSWLPLYHDMGFIACLNLPLAFGAHTVMMQPMDWVANPAMYLRAVDRYRATLGWHPNFAFAFMADRIREPDLAGLSLGSLRGLINCSEPVTHVSQELFRERFSPYGLPGNVFWGCYAMAETTFAITYGASSDPGYLDFQGPVGAESRSNSRPFVSVGRPLAGVDLKVVSDGGQTCSDRQVGELWVKSPFNLSGYHNNPEATRTALCDGWYKTGDLGYQLDGQFFVSGRKKDMLIVAGANLYPQDIEDEVLKVAGIKLGRVAAFAAFDERLQTEELVVVAETEITGSEGLRLLSEVRQRLQAAFNISNFSVDLVAPGWLIKSSAGKMARRANREKWMAGKNF